MPKQPASACTPRHQKRCGDRRQPASLDDRDTPAQIIANMVFQKSNTPAGAQLQAGLGARSRLQQHALLMFSEDSATLQPAVTQRKLEFVL